VYEINPIKGKEENLKAAEVTFTILE